MKKNEKNQEDSIKKQEQIITLNDAQVKFLNDLKEQASKLEVAHNILIDKMHASIFMLCEQYGYKMTEGIKIEGNKLIIS